MEIIEDISGFPTKTNSPRVSQQKLLPTAVQPRTFGDIILGNPASNELGSTATITSLVVPNGLSRTLYLTLSDDFNRTLFSVPDVALYLTTADAANQWPNATINMTNFPVSVMNDWGSTNNVNTVTLISMYNNSGSDRTIVFRARIRFIRNPKGGGSASNL